MRPGKALRTAIAFLAVAFALVSMASECELSKSDREVIMDFFSTWAIDAALSGEAGADDVKNAMDVKDAYNRVTAEQNADRASTLAANGDRYGAINLLDEAIKLNPDKPDYYLQRARLKAGGGSQDQTESLKDYDKYIDANKDKKTPEMAQVYNERARVRNDDDDHKGALDDLNSAVRIKGEDAQLLAQRAAVKRNLGDTAGAGADLDRAVTAKPNDPDILQQRAELSRAQGKTQDALSDYDRAIQNTRGQDAESANKIYWLTHGKAEVQAGQGDYKGAAATVESGLKAYEDRKLAPHDGIYGQQGDYLKAAVAASSDPREKDALQDRAIAAYGLAGSRGNNVYLPDRAQLLTDKALATQDPNQRGNLLGQAYRDADEATKVSYLEPYKGLLARGRAVYASNYTNPSPSASLYEQAITDFKAAITATDAYRGSPKAAQAREQANAHLSDASYNRGVLTGSRADFEQARNGYQAAISNNPNNPYYHEALAQAYDKLGERAAASAARGRADQLRRQGRPLP